MRPPDHISPENAAAGLRNLARMAADELTPGERELCRAAADAIDRLAAAHQETIRHARSGSDWDVVGSAAAARAVDLLEASS